MQETPRSIRSHSHSQPRQRDRTNRLAFDHTTTGSHWSLASLVGYLGILIGVLAIASAPQLVVAALVGAIATRYAGWIIRGLREAIAGSYLRVRRARPQHEVATGR